MKKFETQQVPKDELVKITCDKCGLESSKHGALPAGVNPYIDTIHVEWGFGSKNDMELWEFDLCEYCIEKIFKGIKKSTYENGITPDLAEYDGMM